MIRVMVVDDNDLLRYALRESLYAEHGIELVAECRDGQEAAEQLDALDPDVVVTDLSMPRLDGVDLTRLIMRTRPALPRRLLRRAQTAGGSSSEYVDSHRRLPQARGQPQKT